MDDDYSPYCTLKFWPVVQRCDLSPRTSLLALHDLVNALYRRIDIEEDTILEQACLDTEME